MHFKANVKGDTSNQPLKHYMQVFAPIYSHRSILVKICDRRSISLLLHPDYGIIKMSFLLSITIYIKCF